MDINLVLIFSLLVLLGVITWAMFFRKKKKRTDPFPADWRAFLVQKVHFYQLLSDVEKTRFEEAIRDFFTDVTITGVGISIDDSDRLLVASSAVIPLFGFPGWRYRNLNEVLLYEGTFNEDYQTSGVDRNILGMVGSGAMNRIMILSKPALHQGFEQQRNKKNVGIHEFVHLLDKADGDTDGLPTVLMQKQFVIPWIKLMHEEIEKIKSGSSDINPYGATNQAEFLSVVSEYFFTQPHQLEKNHPELFASLEKIYRPDLI